MIYEKINISKTSNLTDEQFKMVLNKSSDLHIYVKNGLLFDLENLRAFFNENTNHSINKSYFINLAIFKLVDELDKVSESDIPNYILGLDDDYKTKYDLL